MGRTVESSISSCVSLLETAAVNICNRLFLEIKQ